MSVPDAAPCRHSIPVEQTKRKLGDLNPAAQLEGPKQVARRSDMDMNGHINNVTYLAWALETVPQEAYDSHLYEVRLIGLHAWCARCACIHVAYEVDMQRLDLHNLACDRQVYTA